MLSQSVSLHVDQCFSPDNIRVSIAIVQDRD